MKMHYFIIGKCGSIVFGDESRGDILYAEKEYSFFHAICELNKKTRCLNKYA